jgi:hypothetical protein
MLGPFEVRTDDGGFADISGARLRGLVIALALEPGRVVPKATLVVWIWGEQLPADAANALQRLVSRLRKALPEGSVVGQPDRGEPDDADQIDLRPARARTWGCSSLGSFSLAETSFQERADDGGSRRADDRGSGASLTPVDRMPGKDDQSAQRCQRACARDHLGEEVTPKEPTSVKVILAPQLHDIRVDRRRVSFESDKPFDDFTLRPCGALTNDVGAQAAPQAAPQAARGAAPWAARANPAANPSAQPTPAGQPGATRATRCRLLPHLPPLTGAARRSASRGVGVGVGAAAAPIGAGLRTPGEARSRRGGSAPPRRRRLNPRRRSYGHLRLLRHPRVLTSL